MRLIFGLLLLLFPRRLLVGSVAHVRRKAPIREKKAYDTSVRAFSPDGSIYQVEYAVQAADKGGLTIGVQTDHGLVLAAQGRRRSPLLMSTSVSKIVDIDTRMCCAMSGLLPDGRFLLDYARTWVQEHRFEFDEAPSVEAVASQLSRLALKFNGYDEDGKASGREDGDGGLAMARPVGVALLMAGIDRGGRPVLFHLDPSGAYVQWRARAIGKEGTAAEAKLEKAGPFEGMTVRRAMAVVLGVLKEVLADDFSTDRLEMVCAEMDTCCTGGSSGNVDEDGLEDPGSSTAGERSSSSGGSSSDTKKKASAAAGVESSSGEIGAPTFGAPSSPERDDENRVNSDTRESGRNVGGGVGGGGSDPGAGKKIFRGGDSSSSRAALSQAAASFVLRRGYFRRVSTSEMEELLADSSDGNSPRKTQE